MFGQPQPPAPVGASPDMGTPPGMGGGAPAGGGDIKSAIVQAAKQLKKLADENGIDLMAVLSGGGEEMGVPPAPPAPPM